MPNISKVVTVPRLARFLDKVKALFSTHTNDQNNPHGVTKDQVGLGSVDNTADSSKYVAYASTAGTGNKTKAAMTVRFNGGRTEGTDMFTFNGSVAKSVNITPAKIGAVPKTGGELTGDLTLNGVYLTPGEDYGDTIPASLPTGKLFYVKSGDHYIPYIGG